MKRGRLRPLLPHSLGRLPACGAEGNVPRGTDEPWAIAAAEAWGLCGVVAVEDERIVGHALVTTPLHLPAGHPLTGWSRTPHTAALLELHCETDALEGTDKHMVQALAARLSSVGRSSGLQGIEACGSAEGGCHVLAVDWAESVGFRAVEGGRAGVRLRLDLATTVPWRPGLRSAWDLLTGWVERPLAPEPSQRTKP